MQRNRILVILLCLLTSMIIGCAKPVTLLFAEAQTSLDAKLLENQLLKESPAALAKAAREKGDATRGALLFYQPHLACTKCHSTGEKPTPLGPDLSKLGEEVKDTYIVESLLQPSKEIKKGYEPVTVETSAGTLVSGLIDKDEPQQLILRDASGIVHKIAKKEIESQTKSKISIMPTGLVNQLQSRQQFLDLVQFLIEIAEGGPLRAQELRPPASFFAAAELPEYEKHLDHAGLIADLDAKSFQRGEALYKQVCMNCHGTKDKPGSLPTSLRFASGKFKNGADPYSMYQTVTKGFGMMAPQTWMVPQQKYDVIHYIREAYLKKYNPSQYAPVSKTYLAKLPKGDTRGPKPSLQRPWIQMNYGPHLTATYEVGNDGSNFAYTGIAVRLDSGPGGVSQGKHWMLYDHDTMRVAAAWSGKGFMDWNAILFNGQHAVHPRLVGRINVANPTGPGWANPKDDRFDDVRLVGRDGKRYGPLPRQWAHYKGLYHFGDKVIVSYTVGKTHILEMPGLEQANPIPVYSRTFRIGPRDTDMILQVAHQPQGKLRLVKQSSSSIAVFGTDQTSVKKRNGKRAIAFDGATHLEIQNAKSFDMIAKDYTIAAKIKTKKGGSIFCKTATGPKWVRDGKSLFVRGGRLVFDIGWVGAVTSKRRVNDGKWHEVVMTWDHQSGEVSLYIDGALDQKGKLRPKQAHDGHVVRIGYTAPDFPRQQSFFDGEIADVRFYQEKLRALEIAKMFTSTNTRKAAGRWLLNSIKGDSVADASDNGNVARIVDGKAPPDSVGTVIAALQPPAPGLRWIEADDNLRLKIPAGQTTLKFSIRLARAAESQSADAVLSCINKTGGVIDLTALTKGGPPRWPQRLQTQAHLGNDTGPFAVDILDIPAKNPWSCRVRPTGFDFFKDGNHAAVCCWDGDVWLVTGIDEPEEGLTWQRIASGLFQPLGLRIVNEQIYVGCRDQIVILRDLNGDGETDFYENFNSDHQVTDHFHEFAMDLQTDAEGNFYYARGARHAKKALVPHHGTLLKVSKDGSKTEILATGFRAPNGVCLNPDGTFFVSDQEGHWLPKNRINWVEKGGFYGNMWGYHDVTDTSDSAMKQPVCWITNSFDRSPAQLLWVTSKKWGPLQGSLLNLSYGYGKVFVVSHEKVDGQMQGGMCQLPIPQFPTGVMRGRFHPHTGHLYLCGMFAWAGNQTQPGGFYRLRYTGKLVYLPIGLQARKKGMHITFTGKLDAESANDAANYAVKVWSLKRTGNYGSKHYNERRLKVTGAELSSDGKIVFLEIPEIAPTWCMEIRYAIQGSNGEPVQGVIHNTIHRLGE